MTNRIITPPLFIDSIVNYCDSLCQVPFHSCVHTEHVSIGQCAECLRVIHFTDVPSSYLCINSCYLYICKYVHKYASEMYKALNEINFATIPHPRILSLGCGPATELCALGYLKSINTIQTYTYTGVDLNPNWSPIHQFYTENCSEGSSINFQIGDANNFIDQCDITNYDLVVFNYFLSDMVKYTSTAVATFFLQKLVAKFQQASHYPDIIYNDINLDFPDNNQGSISIMNTYIANLLPYTQIIRRCFKNANKPYTFRGRYGEFELIEDNDLAFSPPSKCDKYNPYMTMSAAQIILQTE